MFTKPTDLADTTIAEALREAWGFAAVMFRYQAIGFGSHHWLAADKRDHRLFVTVDDLEVKRRTADEDTNLAFGRLLDAFSAAWSLRHDHGLDFVVAPLAAGDGHLLHRLTDRYSLVVHPYLDGDAAGEHGEFRSDADRSAVLDLLVTIHQTDAAGGQVDDFVVPNLDALPPLLDRLDQHWDTGPYGERARRLLRTHARDLGTVIDAYGELASRVAGRPERMVITHGEPHAGNIVVTPAGMAMVDWDTALRAAPERDLWHLAESDSTLLTRYAAAAGIDLDQDALGLYRMWYDLSEIAGYLQLFSTSHEQTEDARESWMNLRHFLRPAKRWPGLTALA